MISEISTKAKPTNKVARNAFFILLAAGVAVVIAYTVSPLYKGIIGLFAVGFLTAAVIVYTRYMAPTYYYDVTRDYEGTPVFVVRQVTGRRETTLARVTLADIAEIKEETASERKAHKTPYGYRKYFYLPTMSPAYTCRLVTQSRYEKAELVIEVTHEFADMLRAYVSEAKSLRAASEAEEEY